MNEKRANKFSEGFTMNEVTKDQIRESVRDNYKKVVLSATDNSSCCAPTSCCSLQMYHFSLVIQLKKLNQFLLVQILDCGNPQTSANLKENEVVVDLGSEEDLTVS